MCHADGEPLSVRSLIFASLAVVSIVPFCVIPFKGDTLYWDNKSFVNGTEFILISLVCDCMGAIAIFEYYFDIEFMQCDQTIKDAT